MNWKDLFPPDNQPGMEDIEEYIGGKAKHLWKSVIDYFSTTYKIKPKFSYSVCSGKPGWNIKFQKNGQSFGTLYPEENSFSVFMVISYKLDYLMDSILPNLSPETAELYKKAGDYMRLGKWIMFSIKDQRGVDDYKQLISVKTNKNIA